MEPEPSTVQAVQQLKTANAELQVLLDHLDLRLDRLNEKMDMVLEEVGHGVPHKGNKTSRSSVQSSQFSALSSRSPRSPRPKNRFVALKHGLSGSSLAASEKSASWDGKPQDKGDNKMPPRPLSQRGIKQMDLQFARRLHAKEVCQEVVGTDKSMKPFMRLVQQSWKDRIWELLDDPRSSVWAWLLSQVLKIMVLASVVLTTLQISDVPILETSWGQVVELTVDLAFFLEFILRLLATPSKKLYLLDPLNLGDFLSALALPLLVSVNFAQHLPESTMETAIHHILLLFMPLARFAKLLRYFESFRLLVEAFTKSAEALPVLSYITAFMVLFFGTLIYVLEDRSNIPSMPHCLWLALVTMTTVGYGDYYPKSWGGYLTVSALTFASVLFLALPVGIIGYEFTISWQKRGEMFLKMRLRNSLSKWGYGIDDVEILFEYADADEDGQLVLFEFIELIRQLRIGVNVESAAALFQLLDANHDGLLDRGEFLRHIFPDEYAKQTQQIADETLMKSRRRIGMALERLESNKDLLSPVESESHPEGHMVMTTPEESIAEESIKSDGSATTWTL